MENVGDIIVFKYFIKSMKNTIQLLEMPKLVVTVMLIIMIGGIIGMLGFLLIFHPKTNTSIVADPIADSRCNQKVKFSDQCESVAVGVEFDQNLKKCIMKNGDCNIDSPFVSLQECQEVCEKNVENDEVIIKTDKTEYVQGEIIKIIVSNRLDKSILHSNIGNRFWDIEYFKNDRWINQKNEEDGGFHLVDKNIGDTCSAILFERIFPVEILSQSNLIASWNQKICPFKVEELNRINYVKYIESGKYRLVFNYSFEVSDDNPFLILDPKIVYSNEFEIKYKIL